MSEARITIKFSPLFILIVSLLVFGGLSFINCRKEPTDGWRKPDSIAVLAEIEKWHDTFAINNFFAPNRSFRAFTQLNAQDSISATGDSLIKIYHLNQTNDTVGWFYHSDSLAFLIETDTYCDVQYEDYATHTVSIFQCDTIWVVRYQKNPPDTIWRLILAEKRPYHPGELGKVYAWSAPRKLRFIKQGSAYKLQKLSGWAISVPAPANAPEISRIILAGPGIADTWGRTKLDSLIALDSLCAVGVNESLFVSVQAENNDSIINPYYFFVRAGGEKINITSGTRFGQGKVAFINPGIKHIEIEILPSKNLFYPNNSYSSTIWAIPIRIRPRTQ